MKVIALAAVLFSLGTAAKAQTLDDVRIVVSASKLVTNGGEKTEPHLEAGLGKVATGTFSSEGCALFRLRAATNVFEDATYPDGAITGWRVQVTPTRIVDGAVTFRLRWVRGLDNGKPSTAVGENVELTLRPGEGRTIDRVPVPAGGRTGDGGPCRVREASLRVSADYYPMEAFDRRLIAADLWLVERSPNGVERSQPWSVRGLPNRPIPFYFDSVVEGTASLEVFGQIVARPDSAAMELTLQVRSRSGPTVFDWREPFSARTFSLEPNKIRVQADEVVEVALPRLPGEADLFADRVYSIRMRARQVR